MFGQLWMGMKTIVTMGMIEKWKPVLDFLKIWDDEEKSKTAKSLQKSEKSGRKSVQDFIRKEIARLGIRS